MKLLSSAHKPHFWSQLLLSLIAIFALPNAQETAPQECAEIVNASTSRIASLQLIASSRQCVRQAAKIPGVFYFQQTYRREILSPLKLTFTFNPLAPIRGSPIFA